MKIKPMVIIFIGAIIAIIGGLLSAYGTLKQNTASSKRMQDIQSTAREISAKAVEQIRQIDNLKNQNDGLQHTIDTLNNRVVEQGKTIIELTKQNAELSTQLTNTAKLLHGNLVGGDSFCELRIQPSSSTTARIVAISHGDFPLYEVNAKIVDLDLIRKNIEGKENINEAAIASTKVVLEIGSLHVKSANTFNMEADFSNNYKEFNIFFSARNGFTTQQTRLFFNGIVWLNAVRISNTLDNKVLFKEVDPTFPKDRLTNFD